MQSAYHIITNVNVELYIQDEQSTHNRRGSSRGRILGADGNTSNTRGTRRNSRNDPGPSRLVTPILYDTHRRNRKTTEETNNELTTSAVNKTTTERSQNTKDNEEQASEVDDTLDCSMEQRKPNTNRNQLSPWKVIARHSGTRRVHYHIIYISTAKNWGHNSKLGKAIRSQEHKCSQITCIQCLLEYISTGDDRTTLKNILRDSDKKIAMCVSHSLGITPQQNPYNSRNSEGGNYLFPEQSTTRIPVSRRLDFSSITTDEDIPSDGEHNEQQLNQREDGHDIGGEQTALSKPGRLSVPARRAQLIRENQDLVLQLCKNKAFDEGEATRILCSTPEGIAVQFHRNFGERLKTALCIAKTLVFQESIEQRLQRSKSYVIAQDPMADDPETIRTGIRKLENLLEENLINIPKFALDTRNHFYGKTKKKNNLFFRGPPSTGKTMIMESLVEMHYNYSRLTGLTPNSAFNFASLIHTNACFMDECKLTDNQFEQWKLLAGKQPMSTDVKYKNRHNITNCILYTASNYPIDTYISVGEAREAIETRTITFMFTAPTEHFKLNPFIWTEFWKKYKATDEAEMRNPRYSDDEETDIEMEQIMETDNDWTM